MAEMPHVGDGTPDYVIILVSVENLTETSRWEAPIPPKQTDEKQAVRWQAHRQTEST